MNRPHRRWLLLLAAWSGVVYAGDADEVLKNLRELYPATRFDSVRVSPVPGLYEVVMGRNLAYAERTGRYFLFGHLFDLPANRDLTAEVMPGNSASTTSNKVERSAMPNADAILLQPGKPTGGEVAIFSDPLCGYCRRLEQSLADLPDVTVRVFPLPLQPGSDQLTADIWCSSNRGEQWKAWMNNSKKPESVSCDTTAIDRNLALAKRFGVRGTPTLVASDGRVLTGAVSATEIKAWLGKTSTTSHARMETSQ